MCYITAVQVCETTIAQCSETKDVIALFGSSCEFANSQEIDSFCNTKCANEVACTGNTTSCNGGTLINFSNVVGGSSCLGGSYSYQSVACSCTALGSYQQETPIPPGTEICSAG